MAETSPRLPKQARALRTREQLLSAGEAELSEAGFAGATAKSIAKRAGVATGSFYQYFDDKDALLRELATARFASIAFRALEALAVDDGRAVHGDPERARYEVRVRMEAVVQLVMEYHREDPGLHAVIAERRAHDATLDAMTTSAERALIAQIATLLARWRHPGDREAVAFVLFQLVEGAVHSHCLGHALVDDDRFTDALVDALVRVALPA